MKYLIIFLLSTLLFGCTAYEYISSPQYIPLNEKKGDLKINVNSNNLQVGYAFADHFSVFATGYKRTMTNENIIEGDYYRHDTTYEANIGASYFIKYQDFLLEMLVGTGYGHVNYSDDVHHQGNIKYLFNMNSDKYIFFIQPNIGYKFENVLEVCLFSKISYTQYANIHSSIFIKDLFNDPIDPQESYFLGKNSENYLFVNPGIALKLGFEKVKLSAALSQNFNLTDNNIRYRSVNFQVSLFLNFNLLNKKTVVPE